MSVGGGLWMLMDGTAIHTFTAQPSERGGDKRV
jgi:hypothetical protein